MRQARPPFETRLRDPVPGDPQPLVFTSVRLQHGRGLLARAADGSVYCYGQAEPHGPPCAWRDTPGGDRQWIARAAGMPESLSACRDAHRAHGRGDAIAVMDWALREGQETQVRRIAVRLRRNSWGLSFEPLAHGAPELRAHSPGLKTFLRGEAHLHFAGGPPRLTRGSRILATLLAASRQAKGVLSPAERLQAGAGLACISAPDTASPEAVKALRNGLDHVCTHLARHLDGVFSPDAGDIEAMRRTMNGFVRGPAAGALGAVGRAFVAGELAPALARANAELQFRMGDVEARAPSPAVA